MIQGITIELLIEEETGKDEFNNPVYKESWVEVENVLVGEPSAEEILNELNLTGVRVRYSIAVPKGDAHDWKNARLKFFGEEWQVAGDLVGGIEEMIPLDWNKKGYVARYE
jgi:hypothetical protein